MMRTLGVVMLFFGIVELLVRHFNPEIQPLATDRGLVKENVYGKFPALKPNAQGLSMQQWLKVDAEGFWDYGVKSKKQESHILFLGDSVTMGIGVAPSKAFAGLFAQSLPDSVKLLNSSWMGYNYQVYPQILKRVVKQKKVKKVYLFWCWNDIQSLKEKYNVSRAPQKNISYFLNQYYFTFQ